MRSDSVLLEQIRNFMIILEYFHFNRMNYELFSLLRQTTNLLLIQ